MNPLARLLGKHRELKRRSEFETVDLCTDVGMMVQVKRDQTKESFSREWKLKLLESQVKVISKVLCD
jgi:hypothetical protein